eukprot:1057104-Prorocentrum_lima.AAC.1
MHIQVQATADKSLPVCAGRGTCTYGHLILLGYVLSSAATLGGVRHPRCDSDVSKRGGWRQFLCC